MPEIAGNHAVGALAQSRPSASETVRSQPLGEVFQAGQLLELSGNQPGKLSMVVGLLLRAQAAGEPVAFVMPRDEGGFYPPDFAEAGVDLAALVLVRMPASAGPHGLVRAAEVLLRSGAFGVVVVDLSHAVPQGELAWQARLSGLARLHDARVVLLTAARADTPSLGPLIALRVEANFQLQSGRVLLTPRVLKSKLGAAPRLSPDVRLWPVGAELPA